MTYATLSEVKEAAALDGTTSRDTTAQIALDAAVDLIDSFCKRHFRPIDTNDAGAKTSRTFTAKSARLLLVDDVAKVDSVEDRATPTSTYETVDASDYEARPSNAEADERPYTRLVRITGGWPAGSAAVRVTGWFGWPTTPQAIKQATIFQANRFIRRGEAPFGISQVPGLDEGGGMRLLAKLDADVELMLTSYRRVAW